MNAPTRLAQITGAVSGSKPIKVLKIEKPVGGQAITAEASYDGTVKVDFSAIANEKITLVHIGERLIILFDNQSTVTIIPFFDSMGVPLANISIESSGKEFTSAEFASTFPITTDQSVLPAAGDGQGTPASGANFANASVDPLGTPEPLPLLGPEELPPVQFTRIDPVLAQQDLLPSQSDFIIGGIVEEEHLRNGQPASPVQLSDGNEDGNGTPPQDGDTGGDLNVTTHSFTGNTGNGQSLQNLVVGGDQPITFSLNNLTGQPVTYTNGGNVFSKDVQVFYHWIDATHVIGFADENGSGTFSGALNDDGTYGDGPDRIVFTLEITPDGDWTVTIYDQFDHPLTDDPSTPGTETAFEDILTLNLTPTIHATDVNNSQLDFVGNAFGIGVIDDVPIVLDADPVHVTLDEDDIDTGLSLGTRPDDSNGDGSYTGDPAVGGGGPAFASGTLSGLVKAGADEDVTFSFIDGAADHLNELGLRSKGDLITFSVVGNAIVGEADGREVFKLTLETHGDYTVELFDQFDHDPPHDTDPPDFQLPDPFVPGDTATADQNTDLIDHDDDNNPPGEPRTFDLNELDFGALIKATDHDGDYVTLDDMFVVQIRDDIPEVIHGGHVKLTVDEDDISTLSDGIVGGSLGTRPDDGNGDGSYTGDPAVSNGGPAFVSGTLNGVVVQSGADEPLTFGFISEGALRAYFEDLGLTSKSGPLSYDVQGNTLYAFVNDGGPGVIYNAGQDRLVFTFEITDVTDGDFEFKLYDQLDHDAPSWGADQNFDLEVPGLDITSIDFGSVIKATDHDGDSVVLEDKVKIQIKDDVPVLKDHEVCLTVDEDDISTLSDGIVGGSLGTSPNDGNGDGSYTGNPANDDPGPAFVSGTLAGVVVQSGADEGLTFGFISEGAVRAYFEDLGLTSKSGPLSYDIQGNILYAFVNDGGPGVIYNAGQDRLVFTFEITDINDGDFEFKLYDQLDHDAPSWGADQNFDLEVPGPDITSIDFGSVIKATDHDGDSVVLEDKVKIQIKDDVPVLKDHEICLTVDEDDIDTNLSQGTSPNDGNGDGSYTGNPANDDPGPAFVSGSLAGVVVESGADEPLTFSFIGQGNLGEHLVEELAVLAGLSSQGESLRYDIQGNVLYGFVGDGGFQPNSGDRLVFQFTLQPNGDFTFELFDQLDHDPPNDDWLPLDLADGVPLPFGGPDAEENYDLEDNVPFFDVAALPFGYLIKATDHDGDSVIIGDNLVIKIRDDVPEATGVSASIQVDEDELSTAANDLTDGITDNPPDTVTDEATFTKAALQALFTGADEPIKFSLNLSISGIVQTTAGVDVTSQGALVRFDRHGNDIVGFVNLGGGGGAGNFNAGIDREVFRIIENGDGSFTFDLKDKLDHLPLDEGDGDLETLILDLTKAFRATDFDGDEATLPADSIQVVVENDVPVVFSNTTNYVFNGDFSQGSWTSPTWWGSSAPQNGVTGWSLIGTGTTNFERPPAGYLGLTPSTGAFMLDMAGSPGNHTVSQSIGAQPGSPTLTNGTQYVLELEVGAPFPGTALLEVYWNNQFIGTIDTTVFNGTMDKYAFIVTGTGNPATDVITFKEVGTNTSNPVPGTWPDQNNVQQPLATEGHHGTYIANVKMYALDGVVDEDGLTGPLSFGNDDSQIGDALDTNADGDTNEATTTGTLNITWGADNFNGGADGFSAAGGFTQDGGGRNVTFANNLVEVFGTNALTSNGDTISFELQNGGTKLVAIADDDGPNERVVFEVTLSDDGSGAFHFVLKDQLDHAEGAHENDIALKFNFIATDSDGDTAIGSFTVGIDDDVPVIAGEIDCLEVKEDGQIEPGKDANFVLVLDSSGSVDDGQLALIKANAIDFLNDVAASGAENVRIHIVDFDSNSRVVGTFDIVVNGEAQDAPGDAKGDQLQAAIDAINGLSGGGNTNYEAALAQAKEWVVGNTVTVTNAHEFDADTVSQGGGTDSDNDNRAYVLTDANGVRIAVVSAWEPFGTNVLTDADGDVSGGFGVTGDDHLNEIDEMLRFDFGAFDNFGGGSLGDFNLADEAAGFRGSEISAATFSLRSFGSGDHTVLYKVFYTDGSNSGPTLLEFDFNGSNLLNQTINAEPGKLIAYIEFTVPVTGGTGRVDLESVTVGNGPIPSADVNQVIFFSDGEPNRQLENDGDVDDTGTQNAVDEAQDEIEAIENAGFTIEAFGANVTGSLTATIDASDGDNDANLGAGDDDVVILSDNGVAIALVSAWSNSTIDVANLVDANDSSDGIGSDGFPDENLNGTEVLRFDFGPGSDYDNAGNFTTLGFNGPNVTSATFTFDDNNGGGDTVFAWTIHFVGGGTQTGSRTVTNDENETLTGTGANAGKFIDYIEFNVTSGQGRIDLQSVGLGEPIGQHILDQIDSNDAQNITDDEGLGDAYAPLIASLGGGGSGGGSASASAELSTIVASGADENVTFSFKTDVTPLLNQNLKSGGIALFYTVAVNPNGDDIIAATKGQGGPVVFTLTLEQDGTATFNLVGNLDHGGEDFLEIEFDGMIVAVDHDGDPVAVPLCVEVENGEEPPPPQITLDGDIVHDESDGLQNPDPALNATSTEDDNDDDVLGSDTVSGTTTIEDLFASLNDGEIGQDPDFTPAELDNSDPNQPAIGYAREKFVFVANPAEPGVTRAFSLDIPDGPNVDSGLATTEGKAIFLFVEDGLVVGRVSDNPAEANAQGDIAFAIAVDPNTGELFVAQYLSIHHDVVATGLAHDDLENLIAGSVQIVVTDTNSAGSTSSNTNIGHLIKFEDDGPKVEVCEPTGNDFPTWPQDISHIVLYFQQEAGDDAPGANGDGFYLVKIDNVPSLAPDDLDAWIEQALDWLIANDPHIDENSDLLGAVIKGGNEATQFYAYGNHNANGADPDTIPTGAPGITPPPPQGDVDGTNIDQTYEFSVVFPNGAPTESSSGDDCTLTLKLDESVVDPPPPDAPAETGTIAPGDDDIGQAGPNGLTPFGRTTADVSGLFTVDAGSDGEQSKLYTLLMKTLPGGDPSGQVSVVTDILATDLFATQPAPGGNPGAPFGDPRIYLLQAGPYTINGYVGAPNAGEPSGPLALRITIDPSTGVVTLEQYLAIHHTDANDHDFPVTEQSALLEGVLAKLTVTDGDGDVASAEVPVSITIEDDGPSIEHANVFYDDDLTVDESVGADPLDSNANDETTDLPSALDSYATAHNLTVIGAAVRLATPNHTVEFGSDGGTISRVFSLGIGQNSDPITNGTPTDLNMVGTEFPIFLFNEGGLLVGKAGPNVAAAAANGTIMFAIHIDPTTGTVSMAQYRAVEHDSSDHDESDSPAFFELDVKMVVTATDGDGDTDAATASGVSIRFNFEDDGPDVEIVGTSNSVDEGQVVSGNWTLDQGSDGVPSVVVSIDGTGISEPFTFASGEQAIINFPLGTLIVRADGTWQFTANPVAGDQQFTFTIRAADSDGDSDSDSHTITINDVSQPPVITSAADASLDEDGFTGAPYFANVDGSGPNDANETNNLENLTHAGQIQVSFGSDQPGNLLAAFAFQTTGLDGQLQTTDGTAVEFAVESGELVGRRADNDDEVIRIEISGVVDNGGGNIQYNYLATLSQPIKHSGNPTEDSDVLADVPFSVTNSSGPATGSFDVTIWDDVPVARSDSAQVSEGGQSALNLALVVDISESMEENPGVPGFATRIELARAALIEMLENATVNRVAIVRFRGIAIDSDGSNADPDGGDGNLTWMTKAQAIAYLQNAANFDADVISDGGTDYDAPISFVQNEWVAPPAGGDQTLLYFLSDGVPSEGDNTTGIDVGEAATWETFLTTNNVAKAIAVGIGSGVTTTALDPIAYPNGDSSNPVVLTDEGDLIDTLSGTIPGTVSGNVLLGNNGIDDAGSPGGDDDGLGADGGRILSIKVGTVTYTYDPITGDITASTGPNPTANTPALTVTTPAGGTLTFYFAAVPGHAAGDWTYVSPSGLSADVVEPFLYHLVDGDGDTTYATLSITVLNQNVAPVVSGLVVTESGISFNIADPDSSSFTLNPTGANAFGNLTLGLGANFLPATEQPNFTAVTGLLQIDDGTGGIANVVRIHLGTSLSTTFSAGGTTPAAMYGFGGSDNLTGGSAGDWIFGGVGTDTLTGGGGADTLVGGANDDTFSLANGDFVAGESIDGGSGNDTIALTTTGDGQSIDLTVGTISNVENLVSVDQGSGNGYDQTFTLTAAQWAGLSTIDTNDGTDTLNVNVSGNVDVSSLGTTTLTSVENRNITGTGGADSITLTGAQLNEFIGGSNTSINLGGGSDTINLTSTSTDLNGLSNAALTGVETISAASAVANVKINVSNQTEAFTIIGGSGADTLVGGSGSDTLTGNGGVDQFRLRTNGGLDTITDYTDNVDKIAFFDNGSTGSGSVNFGGTAGNAAGAALAAGDFQIRTSISNINSADDRHVILINAAQTTAQITSNTGGSSSENSYVIVFNSTTGRGEIWFDTDWDSTGSRVQIATLDNITSLAQLTAITASDIVVYNSVTDPLILDLGAPGLDFTGVVDGVSFDINADGLPDQMAWTVGEDGILALDVDGNGTIDNGSEIFSPQFAGGEHAGSLAALATLDENGDGRIDAGDSAYQNLKVWQDLDHDGVSDAGELTGLAALGITGINLGATAVDGYVNGQQLLAEGTFTYADGSTGSFAEVGFETELGEGETYVVGADQPPLTIEGFVQGDSLDLSALLDANFQDGDTVGDFIRLEQSGADIKVQVDTNGPSGGANFVDVAVLAGYGTSNADIVRVVFENQTQQLSA